MCSKIEEQNDKIIKQNEDLKQQIALIIEDLSERNVSEASLSENLFEPLKGYPLQTIEQFNELNSNYTLRKQLVRIFITVYFRHFCRQSCCIYRLSKCRRVFGIIEHFHFFSSTI